MTTIHDIDPEDVSWIPRGAVNHVQRHVAEHRAMLQLLDPRTPPAALFAIFDAYADNSIHEYAYFHPNSTVSLRRHIKEHWVKYAGEDAFPDNYPDPATPTGHIEAQWWHTREEKLPGYKGKTQEEIEADAIDFGSLDEMGRKNRNRRVQAFIEHISQLAHEDEEVTDSTWEEATEGWLANFMDLVRVYPVSEVRDAIDQAVANFGAHYGNPGAYGWLRGYLDGYVESAQDSAPVLPKPEVTDLDAYGSGHEAGKADSQLVGGDAMAFERMFDAILANYNLVMETEDKDQRREHYHRMENQVRRLVRMVPEPRTRDLIYTTFATRDVAIMPVVGWATGYIGGYLGDRVKVLPDTHAEAVEAGMKEGARYRDALRRLNWMQPADA